MNRTMNRTMDSTSGSTDRTAAGHTTADLPPPTRRTVVAAGAATAAAALSGGAFPGTAAAASAPSDLILKTVPGTGERLPAIGLGSFMTFDAPVGRPSPAVLEVVRRHWSAGGRVFDCSPLYGSAEAVLGGAAASLGIGDRMFVTDKVWSTGEYLWDTSHAENNLRRSQRRLRRSRPIDVVQVHSLVNVDVMVPLLHALKEEGRIRQLGVSHHDPAYFPLLAGWVERGDPDFVQVHYSIHTRAAEDTVLKVAADRGVAVLVNMPLEKARLHKAVEGRRLPAFAADFGIETWSAFFLKWVISHPAVTVALPATSRPEHVRENVAAMRGPLPDPDTRERMVRHMETIPAFHRIGSMSWYPGKSYPGVVSTAQEALRKRSPWWA
ncbi:aldo/keto reductase [Streptomyces sp. GMY02]|uniref:aldo/keto reductase n=1 Tax=Streptomyces sp. GMY02 TaxID=1333528 RepID=UPI001C2C467B|nr:aldo/keto reductase [Streptomyces sp. GMY02]QXE34337.1 aldo/keto reductase [Streptomyces sp. GMY02]